MAAPLVYAIIVQVGRKFLGTNSKRIADALIKKGGKRIPKTKLPKNAKVSKAPDVVTKAPNVKLPLKKPNSDKALPKNVQLRKDPPVAGSRTTTPRKPSQPKAPAKPKVGTKAPTKQTTRGFKPKNIAKPKRTKPPLTRVPGRTNPVPKKLRSTPAATRIAPLESGPEIDKSTLTSPKKKMETKVPRNPRLDVPKTKNTPAKGPVTNESFGKAFRRNRNAGKPTFMWKGKKYTTRLKEETIAQHKKKFGVEGKY